jgi:hypothetical protein
VNQRFIPNLHLLSRDLAHLASCLLLDPLAILLYFVIQSITMKTIPRLLAAIELMLVFPAVLFMASLFARSIEPVQYQPAHIAQQIVDWYAARPHLGLWILLIAFPMIVLATGMAWLAREWRRDQYFRSPMITLLALCRSEGSALLVAVSTSMAAIILAIVAFHMITN